MASDFASTSPLSMERCWMRFEVAARQVFTNWTLLRLAVDNGWGGRNSNTKAEALLNNVIERFRIAATQTNRPVLVDELTDYLADQILEHFNAEADDDSDLEVAQLLVSVFEFCGKGDFSIAEQIAADVAVDLFCCKKHIIENEDSSTEGEDEDKGDIEIPSSSNNNNINKNKNKNKQPDEDGWYTVTKKK